MPPADHPLAFEGKEVRARIVVDEYGVVLPDSTRFAIAIPDRGYEGRLRASFAADRFAPAVLEGCAVPGRAIVAVTNGRPLR